jgi:hypothetical protein
MRQSRRFFLTAIMIGSVSAASGCFVYPGRSNDGYGPPPHAPAHGYRNQHQGHVVRYDASLGVYVVLGLPNYYYNNNVYYRYDRDDWYYSHSLDRDWRHCDERNLPPGLAKKYKARKKYKKKGPRHR